MGRLNVCLASVLTNGLLKSFIFPRKKYRKIWHKAYIFPYEKDYGLFVILSGIGKLAVSILRKLFQARSFLEIVCGLCTSRHISFQIWRVKC